MNPIKHVAIIMDGNGRWGLKHKNSRNLGHREGLKNVEIVIKESLKEKIDQLTLFTFSTENWKRPKKEINFLFKLLENFLKKKLKNLEKNGIKLKFIGNRNVMLERSPLAKAVKTKNLAAYKHTGFWQSMDNFHDKIKLDKHLKNNFMYFLNE